MFRRYILHIILIIPIALKAVTNPVHINRACLDRVTKTLTIEIVASTDVCGSFTEYVVYGRESALQPYIKLHSHGVLNSTSITVVLPNNKNWEVYISTRFACNGIDTLNSNSVIVDDTAPGLLDIDSVSINLYSQKMYVGWSKAIENDVKGYTLFKVDPTTGINSVIKTLNTTSDSFDLMTFNPANAGNKISIAVYDSCNNEGIISNPHTPVHLSYNSLIFNDLCDKKLRIEWTPYTAPNWTVSSYEIIAGLSLSTMTYKQNVGSGVRSFDLPIIEPGKNHYVYIRAKNSNGFTSSSNLLIINTKANPRTLNLDIGHVTFKDNATNEISIKYNSSIKDSIQNINLYARKQGDLSWNSIFNAKPSTSLFFVQHNCENTKYIYEYYCSATNICNDSFQNSSIYPSILLNKNSFVFTWNNNTTWNTKDNILELYTNTGLPISKTNNDTYVANLAEPLVWTKYQIKVFKKNLAGIVLDSSLSNPQYHLVFDTTLVPNSFHPQGAQNNIFRITNPNLLKGEASMNIYNRYGQKIFKGEALEGWDGKHMDKYVPHGTYVYKIIVERRDIGKQEILQGVVHIIE